ncbi:carboxypeptidase [Listeria floridensis FSL S10-1187]|uniref:Carboxypeptidase n=1 Tax=Listeria floridensis FSL S10-1187 TaxID=1265817 RepID=A0ABP3AVU4_9LIST|nr:amidohydrolase [Listeria floridensis]EUJ28500.1 carboxypeptidase [Listeria floridensis FSL S10-1187]
MREKLMKMLEERQDEMVAIRRHLHSHPELSFKEDKTAQYILDFYEGKPVKIDREVGNGHGIIITIEGEKPGKTIALRADFDALPIEEETGLPFASKERGVMHACGHDGHTAYLLILADCLIELKSELQGTIKIVHQHAEETPPGGAKSIVESGLLDDVEHIYGIHFFPFKKTGEVAYRSGYAMAGRSYFKLRVQGRGGHGSSPHMANDAIVAASQFVSAIQTVVSRSLNPFDMGVVTIGSFDGKGQFNVIKDHVTLEGDIRYMTNEVADKIDQKIRLIASGIETTFGVTCELDLIRDYPPLYNDEKITEQIREVLEEKGVGDYLTSVTEFDQLSGSEDFAYYLEKIPGCFFYIGAAPKGVENPYFNHHPKFDIDEDALLIAAKSVADAALADLFA